MNKKIIMPIALLTLVCLGVFVSAVQKEMDFPGTTITGEFVQQNMQFGKGWNLVQGILNPEWIQTNSDSIKAIYAFNPTTDEYVRFYPEPENDKIGETNFAWSTWGRFGALWVYSEKDFNSNYWKFENFPLAQTPLFSGWNFIGITSDMLDKSLGSIRGSCDIQKYAYWDNDYQRWETSTPETLADQMPAGANIGWYDIVMFEQFQLGEGILFKVSSDCTLGASGSSNVPELPNIPN